MISKERLEELIEEGAKIYAIVKNPFIAGYSQILEVEEFDLNAPIHKEISEDGKQFLYFNYLLELEYLFETKEDAEFVLKFHTHKTLYFKPPTWEEFLNIERNEAGHICWKNEINYIILNEWFNHFYVCTDNIETDKYFNYTKDNVKQKYYEAVEYAKKLFLGEEK